jgi:pilus assembly protein CpaB
MNRNILIVLGGGFLIALLVAIIVQASFGSKDAAQVEIAVAATTLTTGTHLSDANVQWKAVPEETVYEGAILRAGDQSVAQAVKGRLRRDVAANEPILTSYLLAEGQGNVLAASMKSGMRAVAIKASAESMVGGFINPGDHVDVILSYEIDTMGQETGNLENPVEKHATETVLENVKVLAIDQTARKEDNSAVVGRTVTLEVDQKSAEKLALATQMGELSLSLRAIGDSATARAPRQRMTTDVQISPVLREINRNKRRTSGNANIMRIYSGDTVENVSVRR